MHTTNRYSVGICIHAAATAAATTTKTAMALRILGSSVRNWWQGLGRNQSSATASSWVHENEQAAYGRHVSIAGGPAGVAAHYVSPVALRRRDRKSTRLNSSHLVISYAVFCLKKKKRKQ